MSIALWIEAAVIAVYVAGAFYLRRRIGRGAARWAFWSFGVLLAVLVALQVAAAVYLRLNPIEIDLGPW